MNEQVPAFGLWPPFPSLETYTENYFKVAWMIFPFVHRLEAPVLMVVNPSLKDRIDGDMRELANTHRLPATFPAYFDPKIGSLGSRVFSMIYTVCADDTARLEPAISKCERLFVWKKLDDPNESPLDSLVADKEQVLTDKEQVSHETWLYHQHLTAYDDGLDEIREQSMERFTALRSEVQKRGLKRACVVGSGPSLVAATQRDMSDCVTVISNGGILNDTLVDAVKPMVLTGIDPLYHSGPSSYSGQFRSRVKRAILEHGSYFVTRLEFYRWYADYFGNDVESHIIAASYSVKQEHDPANLTFANRNGNVLVASMLPIAASLVNEVCVIGCDGRPPKDARQKEDIRFFWRHQDDSQLTNWQDVMPLVAPRYFSYRDFDAYFERHCQEVDQAVVRLNERGATIRAPVDSHIPALHRLFLRDPDPW